MKTCKQLQKPGRFFLLTLGITLLNVIGATATNNDGYTPNGAKFLRIIQQDTCINNQNVPYIIFDTYMYDITDQDDALKLLRLKVSDSPTGVYTSVAEWCTASGSIQYPYWYSDVNTARNLKITVLNSSYGTFEQDGKARSVGGVGSATNGYGDNVRVRWTIAPNYQGKKLYFKFDYAWLFDASDTDYPGISANDVAYVPYSNVTHGDAFLGYGLNTSTIPNSITTGRILDFKLHKKDSVSTRTISWDSIASPFINRLDSFYVTANSKTTKLLGTVRTFSFNDSNLPYDQKQTIQIKSISKLYPKLNSTQTIVNNGYICPTSITLSGNKCDKSVTLSWNTKNNVDGNKNVIYAVYRKKEGETNYTYLKSTSNSTTLSIVDDSPALEFGKLYTYVVRCIPTDWKVLPSDSRFLVINAETIIASTVTFGAVRITLDAPTFSMFSAKPNATPSAPSVYLTWAEEWCKNSKVDLIRKVGATTDTIRISDGLNVAPPTYYEDKGVKNGIPAVQMNIAYTYQLKVTQTGNKVVYSNIISADLTKMMVFDDTKFKATKGTMSDRISVTWTIDDALLCNEFVVERREYNAANIANNNNGWREVRTLTCTKRTEIFDDMTIMNGIAYQYRITGKYYVTTSGVTKTLSAQTMLNTNSVGFCQPVGNISGRISFKTGASVKDVEVVVDQLTNDTTSLMYRSLSFNGTNNQYGKVDFPKATHPCVANGMTFQCWVNPITRNQTSYEPIAELKDEFSVWLDKQTIAGKIVPVISLYLDPISKLTPVAFARIDSIGNTDFFHVTATYDQDSSLVKLFLNGKLKVKKIISDTDKSKLVCKNSSTDTAPLYLGASFDAVERSRFKGKIDEVRIYNRPLQAKEVLSTSGRYINGEEKGLVGYWRMDEGITQFAFDCSSVNKVFNENHMSLMGATSVVDNQAKRKQLSIKGVTNEDGNYIIAGIPFVGDGMPFSVTPMYDAHSFEPTQRLRFIGNGATVHNGTDFTDISSFKIGGTINYANTNVPVENVEVYIDGEAQIREGKVVTTDIDGKYNVDVPIGYHNLEFKKYGHNFTDGGRWPKTVGGKILFDESTYKLLEEHNVMDSTLTVLSGRVVGGKIQSSKQLGAKRSVANIGQADIILQLKTTSSALILNTTANTLTQQSSFTDITSTSSVAKGAQQIKISTDPNTGEFYTKLPPLNYEVKSITTTNKRYYKSDFKDIPDVVNLDAIVPINETWNDTTWVYKPLKKIDKITPKEISFNVRFDAIYNAPTTLELYPLRFKQDQTIYVAEAFGDSLMRVRTNSAIEKYDTIPAYTKVKGIIKYKVAAWVDSLPIYKSDNAYGIRVKAYESYAPPTSKVNDLNFVKDYCTLPKSGTTFSVENGLAAKQVDIKTQETTPNQSDGLKLGDDGIYDLWFITGFPDSKGRPMKFIVTLEDNTSNVGKGFDQAYMTGVLPTDGSDFITSMAVPLTVLRDPPGSNSYAYYEAGSELENANTISTSLRTGTEYESVRELGVKVSTLLGMTVTTEVEGTNKGTNNFKTAFEWNSNTKMSKKIALTEKISTSASPDMVGRDADVFIGTGTNIYQTPTNDLSLIFENNTYKIKNSVSQSICLESATTFYYPRKHIVNILLPQLRKELEGLLKTVDASQYNANYPNLTNTYKYITTLDSSATNLGEKGTYIEIPPKILPDKYSNKVKERLNDITKWKQWLSDDEQFTLEAKKGDKVGYKTENISYASGATIEKTYTATATKEHNSEFKADFDYSYKNETGATINETGLTVSFQKSIGGGAGYSINVNSANHTTYGYVLQDDNLSDYMAIDVCMPTNATLKDNVSTNLDQTAKIDVQMVNGGPLFFLKGGISQCPYEGSATTQFYDKGKKLNDGTLAIDVPSLYIDAKNSQFINVPAGKPANVVIEMSNNTLTNVQSMFTLNYDVQKSNGALVTMDGVSIMDGKSFLLSKDQILKKTIQIQQTQPDVLNYDIYLTLSPACDLGGASASTQRVRVSFMPTCSDITLDIAERLNNTNTSDTLRYKIKDFDIRYDGLQEVQFQSSVNGGLTWTLERKYTGFNTSNSTLLRNDVSVPGLFVNGILSDKLRLPVEDGEYYFRARSKCKKGNDEYFVESEPIKVVKDQYRPRVMAFSPNNGILTPENEFSVLFNEDLNTGVIKPAIYKLTAILNDSITKGGVSLKTNGAGATSDSPIYLNNSSFTIQGWFRYPADGNGTLFKLGDGVNQVSLAYQNNTLVVKTGLTGTSTINNIIPTTWEFLSLSYNADTDSLCLSRIGSGTGNKQLLSKSLLSLSPQGRLTVGGALQAEVYNMSIWSKAMSHSAAYANKDLSFSGKEINMLAYWPMGEGKGTVTVDRVSSRSLLLNESVWGFTFDNRAISVDANHKFSVPFGETVFTNEQDFSIEFWMKGAKQVNTTLLSLGDGKYDFKVDGKFSLSFDALGQLQLLNSKQAIPLTTGTITDNAWHQLALTVTRGGVSKFYVDGTLKSQFNSSNLGQIYGSNLRLGGRRYNRISANDLVEDLDWTGQFDEFRVWKTALTPEFIRDMCNTKVKGDETALALYYPFEKYSRNDAGNLVFENTTDNMVIGSKQKADSTSTPAFTSATSEAPGMRDASLVSNLIRATGIVSTNKIVFDLSAYGMNRIEGTTIHLWVDNKGIEDKNGNLMMNPVEKSVYVDMNRLNWESQLPVNLKKEVMATASFKAIIVNASSKIESYVINGIPEWLECSDYTGQLNPLERKELTFTANSAVNIGSYECLLSLVGNNNIEERLPVTLNVTGQRPNWSVNPGLYSGSMSITGKLFIGGLVQEDENDLIAAFRGTTCVGITSPKYLKATNNYLVFLDVYGEGTNNGSALTFNLWDASTGRVYPNVNVEGAAITYSDGGIIGTLSAPKKFDAMNKIEQTMPLNVGWNWVSTYVKTTPTDLFNQFKNTIGDAGDQIKNSTLYKKYDNQINYWSGSLDSLNSTSLYLVKATKSANVILVGEMINPSTVSLSVNKNWNWLGYTPNFVMPTSAALFGLNAQENDLIKGQSGYAIYTNINGWMGSLTFMQPGHGYMYYSNSTLTKNFSYPIQYVGQNNIKAFAKNSINQFFTVDKSKYQMNMVATIIATINGTEVNKDKFEVAAFSGNECRGSVTLKYEPAYNRYIGFLMVYGDQSESLTIKGYDADSLKMFNSKDKISYEPNGSIGTPSSPMQIHFSTSAENGIDVEKMGRLTVYPTFVKKMFYLKGNLDEINRIVIVNSIGVNVLEYSKLSHNYVDISNLPTGVYNVRFEMNNYSEVHTILKE